MDFIDFLNDAVTPYHTVAGLKKFFYENNPSKDIDFFERGGALIAVKKPKKINEHSTFRIALAHTDFPALKLAPIPDKSCTGISKIHTEVYGGALLNSWLDKDLCYAGIIAYEDANKQINQKLIRGKKLFKIPQLAIHLNRNINQEGLKINAQTDLDALWQSCNDLDSAKENFLEKALSMELAQGEKLLDFDIQLFDAQPAAIGGFNDEWIFSGRLDNLSSCHAIAQAFINAPSLEDDFLVAAFFNNEEVGSTTREGADGSFLKDTLELIYSKQSNQTLGQALAKSFALSIDMAHAAHPNHPEKHEENHAPILGKGIVLKTNAQKRYASDVFSCARLRQLCSKANIPLQVFTTRNDMPCGSTVGPTISANLGIPTVDIGEPMLSMHSIREMMSIKDHTHMIQLIQEFWKD
ncbi:MAG: M18 family aminopeptidase [Fibrobacteraceae bacterium]|nr:M18 family aminopeptidase [Fibrobacteraceae bacterium]